MRSHLYRGLDALRWRIRNPQVLEVRRLLAKSQWQTPEKIKTCQDENLRLLIEYAYKHVPYYQSNEGSRTDTERYQDDR
jgi:phenylacetate-coenzyme A ligase PaaK-like adenylate-forming protein